jgi:hypothetical protein
MFPPLSLLLLFWFSLRLTLRSLRLCVEYAFLFDTGFARSGTDAAHPLLHWQGAWLPLFAAKPNSRGFIQGFFEGDGTLSHGVADQPFHVGIQSDRGPHVAIIASQPVLS